MNTITTSGGERMLVPYTEAMQILGGIGRSRFFQILPELEKVALGRRRFVTAASLSDYVCRLAEQTEQARAQVR
jgi:hypothetical protein